MPVEALARAARGVESRLSSFGFSGTIAHGAFGAAERLAMFSLDSARDLASLYRGRRRLTLDATL